jgi:predicted transcriptional regulator
MKDKSRIFTVIVGDLVGSRKISDRRSLARKIRSVINRINKEFQKEFYAPLTLKGMDELSGILKQTRMSYRICRHLNEKLYPHLFRFAIVTGVLDIALDTKDARTMDGPAFHRSADMIRIAKKEDLYYCFDLKLPLEELNQCLNELTNMIHLIRADWTKHQRLVVDLYQKRGNQKKVAKRLGITQQAVSDAIQQAHWKELKRVEEFIDRILEGNYINKP